MLHLRASGLSVPALLLVAAATFGAAPRPGFQVADRWTIGGEGGWDYVSTDPEARRLYVTHSGRVEVLDLDKGTRLGVVQPLSGVHGVALAREFHRGFASSGRDSSVVVFDLDTFTTLARIPVPARFPDAILYEPVTKRVFSFNGGSANTTAIDAARGVIVGSIALGGTPEFAQADGRGHVFVNIESTSELAEFDARTLAVVRRWKLGPGEGPSGLAFDREHHRLFSVCVNGLMVVSDAEKGVVLTTLPIGKGPDGVVFDPRRRIAVSSNGEGTLTVVHEDSPAKFTVASTDSTERGARTIALDEKTGRVFSPTASFGPPPEPTAERPHPRGPVLPGSFRVLVLKH